MRTDFVTHLLYVQEITNAVRRNRDFFSLGAVDGRKFVVLQRAERGDEGQEQ